MGACLESWRAKKQEIHKPFQGMSCFQLPDSRTLCILLLHTEVSQGSPKYMHFFLIKNLHVIREAAKF